MKPALRLAVTVDAGARAFHQRAVTATRIAVFLAVVFGLTAALHYYLWVRLVRDPALPAPWGAIGTWVLVGLALSIPVGLIASQVLSREATTPFAWVSFGWMGVMFLLFVLLLPGELVRLGSGWFGHSEAVASPERRLLLSRVIATMVVGVGAGLSAWAVKSALSTVRVRRITTPLRELPEAMRGLSIVQLTDIHVGPTIGRAFVEEIVRQTNALEPDVVAITGDLVDGTVADLGKLVAPLGALRARHGVYFVTGNHEYYSGVDEWTAFLESLGIRVLRNERVTLTQGGAELDLAGVDDWEASSFGRGHGRNLPKALEGKPADRKVVLLAHQPKQVLEAAEHAVDLQLSGHTHGGQIMPFNLLVRLQQPYVAGLHQHGPTTLYVSPGTGYWGPPMRLGVPAEITRVELVPA